MRAVIHLINDGYVNIPGDSIKKENEWFIVRNEGEIVGMFDEGEVKGIHLSDKKQKLEVTEHDNS